MRPLNRRARFKTASLVVSLHLATELGQPPRIAKMSCEQAGSFAGHEHNGHSAPHNAWLVSTHLRNPVLHRQCSASTENGARDTRSKGVPSNHEERTATAYRADELPTGGARSVWPFGRPTLAPPMDNSATEPY